VKVEAITSLKYIVHIITSDKYWIIKNAETFISKNLKFVISKITTDTCTYIKFILL